jgi:hypothetical protein
MVSRRRRVKLKEYKDYDEQQRRLERFPHEPPCDEGKNADCGHCEVEKCPYGKGGKQA